MADLKTTNIYGDAYINNKVGIATNAPATRLQIGQLSPTAATEGIQFGDDTGARLHRINTGHIRATGGISSATFVIADNYLQTNNNLIYPASQTATQRLEVGNASGNAWIDGLTIAQGGNVTVYNNLTTPTATVSGYITFPNDTTAAGLINTANTAWLRLDDGGGNMHMGNVQSGAGIYCDSNAFYWRTINGATTLLSLNSNGDLGAARYLSGTYVSTSDDTSSTTVSYIMAKFGDNFHRSAPAAKVATFLSGQTMNIVGTSTNITAYTINQNVGTANSPTFAGIVSSAITNYAYLQVVDANNFWITPGNANWGLYFETIAGGLLGGTGDSNRLGFVGSGAARFYVDLNNGNGWFGGTLTAVGNISGANLSGTNTGDQSIGNGTITIAASTGVSVGATNTFTTNQSGATTVTITNTGVTALTTNTGLSTNASATGAVTITNTGVTSVSAGTGIGTSAGTGAVTITNSGVTSAVAGTGVGVSAGTGAVTFSIGQAVGTANSPTFVAVTTSTDGANLIMAGSSNAEGIRMTPASSTTYPVFLRSINPGSGGEASPWIYKEQATEWGIWHNNPVNSIDFTKAGSGGIASNVGGGTNTVVVRVEMGTGYVQTIAGYRNSAGTTILDNSGNITGNAATVTNGIYTTSILYIGTTAITMSRSSAAQTLTGVSIDGNAANITAYTINQNVGTANSPTFATLQLTRLNFGATGAAPYAAASGEGFGNGITFGGDENSAAYRIFTGMENIGGNYSKLTLNWHTGIRIGAYYGYGGIRFFNNYYGAGSEIFSVGNLDSNVRVVNSLIVNGITINQERATNARMYGAGTGAFGLLGLDSAGSFRWQLYGEGSNYGFLNGAWAGWDIKKTVSGALYLNSNDTYYLNPASTTNLLSLTVANTITGAVSGNAGTVTNGLYTTGGQTIAGITYFSNGESMNVYGIRGRFTNEYLHLYSKVGVGHPGGWGQGETSTPTQGLSTYGGLNIAYGDNGISTFNGVIRANSNIRQGADLARPLSSWSVSGTSTGMVIFSFPGNTGNYGMVHCVFDIYEYNSNTVSTVIVGGHNWNGAWYNFGANVIGRCGKSVRLGVKDSKFCVVFGGAASSWDYGTIILRKIHNGGFYTGIMDMGGSFTTQQTATESFSNISGDLRALITSADFIADGGISGTTGTFSGELNIAGNYQIRNANPTITFRDTNNRTGYIHVNGDIFYVLTAVADSGYGNWATVANGRWPMELNLSNNNALFGGVVDAISFTGAGTGLTGTAASLNIGGNANNITQYTVNQSVGTGNSPTFVTVNGTSINIAGNGAGYDTYGTIGVTEPAGAPNYSYYALTRQSNIGTGFGLTGTNGALGLGANAFWFGSSTGGVGGVMGSAYIAFNGSSLVAVGTVDATQFRDRDDTAYYLDPAGTSNLNQWSTSTAARLGRSRYWTNRLSKTADTNYHTGTNGWGVDEGTWANAWKGGFSGWDIWGTSTDHPQGAGYIHAQGIVSGQHLTTANGNNAYGWMMVGATNATDNRYWLRGKWDTSISGWVEMLTSGNYNSFSPTLTGTGASGTWSINVTGNAGGSSTSCSGNAATATALTSMNISQFTNNSGYLTSVTNISGNAATATTATNVGVGSGNTSAAWYPVVWHSGNTLYSSAGVQIYAANNYVQATYFNSSDNDETGITRFVIKNGDGYHRSATPTSAAVIIRGVASGTWSITAATATNVAASGITGQTGMWTSAARPGPYRLYRRDSDDDYSVQNYWTGVYWRLDGYYSNNTVHAGCSVSYADTAGTANALNTSNNYRVTNFGIDISPANKLHINGDNVNPTIRVDNGAIVTGVASNSKSFYGFMPVSISGTTKYIQLWN